MRWITKEPIFDKILETACVLTISVLLATHAEHYILIFSLAVVFLVIISTITAKIMRLEAKQSIHKVYAKIIYCSLGGIVFFFYKLTELDSKTTTHSGDSRSNEIFMVILIALICTLLKYKKH